ncbi:hypothetical protein [Altererythrobacter sp. MF3-039]|uniref:hypothetical protein n=1 Tax=Altererythrobacter sp. MF3-039 TaxID=3252901 RepID=UPI00390CD7FD
MPEAVSQRERVRSRFFFWMSLTMLVCTVIGFGSALAMGNYNDVEVPLPSHLVVHGIVLLAWFSWLVLQTSLVRAENTAMHRKTGVAGVFIGLLVIATTPQVFLKNPERVLARGLDWTSDMSEFPALGMSGITFEEFSPVVIFSGIANLVSFGLLLGGALWWRSSPAIHKRLMLLASIAIFAPALARISRLPGLGGEGGVFTPIALFILLIIPLVYDRVAEGKFHKVNLFGIGVIIVVQASLLAFAGSDMAKAFARSLA